MHVAVEIVYIHAVKFSTVYHGNSVRNEIVSLFRINYITSALRLCLETCGLVTWASVSAVAHLRVLSQCASHFRLA